MGFGAATSPCGFNLKMQLSQLLGLTNFLLHQDSLIISPILEQSLCLCSSWRSQVTPLIYIAVNIPAEDTTQYSPSMHKALDSHSSTAHTKNKPIQTQILLACVEKTQQKCIHCKSDASKHPERPSFPVLTEMECALRGAMLCKHSRSLARSLACCLLWSILHCCNDIPKAVLHKENKLIHLTVLEARK